MPTADNSLVRNVVERRGDGTPPIDILGLSVALVLLSVSSFWLAILSQFGGPVVEEGIAPQTVAGLLWGTVGVALVLLAVSVYQRRPIGWYGTFLAGVLAIVRIVGTGIPTDAVGLAFFLVPIGAIGLLVLRRDLLSRPSDTSSAE